MTYLTLIQALKPMPVNLICWLKGQQVLGLAVLRLLPHVLGHTLLTWHMWQAKWAKVSVCGHNFIRPWCWYLHAVTFPVVMARFMTLLKILVLPDDTEVYLCHDYPPEGENTVLSPPWRNRRQTTTCAWWREPRGIYQNADGRDATPDMPRLIIPAVQVNIDEASCPSLKIMACVILKFPLTVSDCLFRLKVW